MCHRANNVTFADGTGSTAGGEPRGTAKQLAHERQAKILENLHALSVEFMTTWQAHDTALTIDIFFKTYHTLHLPFIIFSPPRVRPGSVLFFRNI